MDNLLTLLKCFNQNNSVKLHNDIINILFSHKKEISNRFRNIKGLYCLDHIAINIFNPANEVVIFSQTPSIEYNLIVQDLWKSDPTFYPDTYQAGALIWWEQELTDAYNEIKKIKQADHNFVLGFNLYKKVNDFKFVYSFATRNKDENIRWYYKKITQELSFLGDYCYKLINDIYQLYCAEYKAPEIISNYILKRQYPYLRLISDNEYTPC